LVNVTTISRTGLLGPGHVDVATNPAGRLNPGGTPGSVPIISVAGSAWFA
jgi:hypothetical protein